MVSDDAVIMLCAICFIFGLSVGGIIESLRAQLQIKRTGRYKP